MNVRNIRFGIKSLLGALPLGGLGWVLLLTSCIDEDLSKCGVNYNMEYVVVQGFRQSLYQEMAQELSTDAERAVGTRLEGELGGVCSDIAHDLDLSFYIGHRLTWHQNVDANASTARLTVYMKRDDYRNLAVANVAQESVAGIEGTPADTELAIGCAKADTVESQRTALFSSRLDMAAEDYGQTFRSNLYMVNCMAALVLNRQGHEPTDIRAFVVDMAESFAVSDSVYSFAPSRADSHAVRTRSFTDGGYDCLYAVTLPSREGTPDADDGLWRMKVYVTMPGGKVTENILAVNAPLRAGEARIIKARLNDDGSIDVDEPEIGVSVTLDWKPGGSHDVEI